MSPSEPERSNAIALATARRIRGQFIDLSYLLPDPATPEILRLWNVADTALMEFVNAMEAYRK
jgi:hypothetical protein